MTDNEITKALECCWHKNECIGNECPFFEPINDCTQLMAMEVLDLINRQKAEIEAIKHYYNECLKDLKNANAEIERLKERDETAEKIIREQSSTILHLKDEVNGYSEKAKTFENVIKNTFLEKAGIDINPLAEIKAENNELTTL